MAHRIMVVDDDPDLVAGLKLFLESKGFEVSSADSGEAAFKALEAGPRPDAMILDVMMAGRADGFIFVRRLRKMEPYRALPVVMLTGMRQATGFAPVRDDPRDPVFLPVDAFMEKPVDREKLLSKLREVVKPAA